MNTILTIAGSDPSGGAGVQADIKTIHRLGAHAATAVTVVTAQSSQGLQAVFPVPGPWIEKQVEAVLSDVTPQAVKIGMLKTLEAVRAVCSLIERHRLPHVVLDPVLRASAGGRLLDEEAVKPFLEELVPRVHVVTPNIDEAALLTGRPVATPGEAEEAAGVLKGLGPDVVVTGGHLPGACVDILCHAGGVERFHGNRLEAPFAHGSGCVFSSALAAGLGRGAGLRAATARAREVAREALNAGYALGNDWGVVHPLGVARFPGVNRFEERGS